VGAEGVDKQISTENVQLDPCAATKRPNRRLAHRSQSKLRKEQGKGGEGDIGTETQCQGGPKFRMPGARTKCGERVARFRFFTYGYNEKPPGRGNLESAGLGGDAFCGGRGSWGSSESSDQKARP